MRLACRYNAGALYETADTQAPAGRGRLSRFHSVQQDGATVSALAVLSSAITIFTDLNCLEKNKYSTINDTKCNEGCKTIITNFVQIKFAKKTTYVTEDGLVIIIIITINFPARAGPVH